MNLATMLGSIALMLTFSTSASAAWYRYTVDGELTQYPGSISAFGVADRVIPFHATFVVATDFVPTTEIAAGTPIYSFGASFPDKLQLITRENLIAGFGLTIGNATIDRLQTSELGDMGFTFDVMLVGDLRVPTGIVLSARNALGEFHLGAYICSETTCTFIQEHASALSYTDGGGGSVVSNVQISARLITNSPQTAIADISEDLLAIGLPKGATNSLLAKLGGALDKLDPYSQDRFAARNKLDAFINELGALRDKQAITSATADRLIDKAQSAQALIY